VSLVERSGGTLRLTATDLAAAERALPAVVAGASLALRRLEADEVSLEEVFVELVGEQQSAPAGAQDAGFAAASAGAPGAAPAPPSAASRAPTDGGAA
jgi:pyruvate/2-oxoglutarate dehydrogenase complex dihydrolipoamide acyltransferase (E2) component